MLTGKLGEVMQRVCAGRDELSLARRCAGTGARDFYQRSMFTFHFPEGVAPKDGPSAGITDGDELGVRAAAGSCLS